jgi:hypothetical protein
MKNRLNALEARKKVKRELPWDCKNLMSRYRDERARREILSKFYDITGVAYEAPVPYMLEVENQRGLSREAREFLSLSAEKQAEAVKKYYFSETEGEAEEKDIRLEEIIHSVGGLEEFEHRLTRGCKFMGIEPLNVRLNSEKSLDG